jgi:hypothetical protein
MRGSGAAAVHPVNDPGTGGEEGSILAREVQLQDGEEGKEGAAGASQGQAAEALRVLRGVAHKCGTVLREQVWSIDALGSGCVEVMCLRLILWQGTRLATEIAVQCRACWRAAREFDPDDLDTATLGKRMWQSKVRVRLECKVI